MIYLLLIIIASSLIAFSLTEKIRRKDSPIGGVCFGVGVTVLAWNTLSLLLSMLP